MSNITIFSGSFCNEDAVAQEIISGSGFKLITDKDIVVRAAAGSGISEVKITKAFSSRPSIFNKFTHEKERSIAYLRLAIAEMLAEDNLFITGFTSQLVSQNISHILRVCLIAGMQYRVSRAYEKDGLTKKEATTLIHKQDGNRGAWIDILFKIKDPWDPEIYDLVIPMDKTDVKNAAAIIRDNAKKEALQHTDITKNSVADFMLAAKAEVALADEGHNVGVSAKNGIVTITIHKHVLMLSRLEDELKSIAEKIPDVRSVKTEVGEGYYRTDSYRKYDFEMPSKVLLVDDEREFVQTLSERLLMRDMGSAVAYDGESALDLINDEEPEVMILDLKMPGIDGIEVLRRVKSTNPDVEVIILTGHGSEQDKKTCMDLGAFAYMHKPVDIELLSDTIKQANKKMRKNFNQRV